MQLQENVSLKAYNTFGIDVAASHFSAFQDPTQLQELLELKLPVKEPALVLGGGSNVLFTGNQQRLVLKNEISGIERLSEDDRYVYVKAGAGENWHQFVLYCIGQNLGGVENLSLIPGNIGAGPMQNIGAYGVELKDVFHELVAYHRYDRRLVTFRANDCKFGYRESVFKKSYKGQFVILHVVFRLMKQPVFNTSYGAIEAELNRMGVQEKSIGAISQAVINIRRTKLPDPAIVGNAGSFFKNPELPDELYQRLKNEFPGIVGYPNGHGQVKLAAGWLIEQCGWKGYRSGDAGCHAQQALVLVNFGHASGEEIYSLSEAIRQSVQSKFGVRLEREVNVE